MDTQYIFPRAQIICYSGISVNPTTPTPFMHAINMEAGKNIVDILFQKSGPIFTVYLPKSELELGR